MIGGIIAVEYNLRWYVKPLNATQAVCLSHKLMTDSMIFLTFTFLGLLGSLACKLVLKFQLGWGDQFVPHEHSK